MESPPFFLMVYYSRGCQGQYARMLQVKLARLHVVELVAHEVDVERRDDIRRAGDAADLAVLRVGDAGQEVNQAARRSRRWSAISAASSNCLGATSTTLSWPPLLRLTTLSATRLSLRAV